MPDTKSADRIVEIGDETYDLDDYDFPTRMDSPDPLKMIEAIREAGGVLADAADIVGCGRRTVYNWVHRYEPIKAALVSVRDTIGVEAKETLVELMREADDRTRYKAAVKLANTYHPRRDFSDRSERTITHKDDEEETPDTEEIGDMDTDDLLDLYNKLSES